MITHHINAGQFVNTVLPHYAAQRTLAQQPQMYHTEQSPLATPMLRDRLYVEWRLFWDLKRPILVEKSPPHSLITRLLQYYFTPAQTYYIALLRHPLAQTKTSFWSRHSTVERNDCGALGVIHWLKMQVTR